MNLGPCLTQVWFCHSSYLGQINYLIESLTAVSLGSAAKIQFKAFSKYDVFGFGVSVGVPLRPAKFKSKSKFILVPICWDVGYQLGIISKCDEFLRDNHSPFLHDVPMEELLQTPGEGWNDLCSCPSWRSPARF